MEVQEVGAEVNLDALVCRIPNAIDQRGSITLPLGKLATDWKTPCQPGKKIIIQIYAQVKACAYICRK
jgi:hypothetical protein